MIGASVQRGLRQEGYSVDWLRDGREIAPALAATAYDLLLLDLGLPGIGGLLALAQLRQNGVQLPVLILTARDAVADRIQGLDTRADDYLVKPFDLDEFAARVRALLRRQTGRVDPVIRVGELAFDPATRSASLGGRPVVLSARELALLEAFLEQPGKPLSRAQLEERIYGWGEEVESNAVEVHIHGLRRKLGAQTIKNLRGVGYFIPKAD